MKRLTVILFSSLLALASANAAAEPPPSTAPAEQTAAPKQKNKNPCQEDIKSLCAGVQKGEGRIGKCLDEHAGQVSGACKTYRQQNQELKKAMRDNCRGDVKQFCADLKAGHGAIIQCLNSHAAQISPNCANTLKNDNP